MYHILHKIADEYFCVSKLRKPIATIAEAKEKIKALKTLDAGEKYIILKTVDMDEDFLNRQSNAEYYDLTQ